MQRIVLNKVGLVAIAPLILLLGTAMAGCAREQALGEPPTAPAPSQTVAPVTAAVPSALRTGSFASAEHPTQGTARIIEENGTQYLEFDGAFRTDSGPDLTVVLHKAEDILAGTQPPSYPLKEGDYVSLGALQATSGAQRYAIPASIDLSDYASVAVWCRQFNATFGVATLQ